MASMNLEIKTSSAPTKNPATPNGHAANHTLGHLPRKPGGVGMVIGGASTLANPSGSHSTRRNINLGHLSNPSLTLSSPSTAAGTGTNSNSSAHSPLSPPTSNSLGFTRSISTHYAFGRMGNPELHSPDNAPGNLGSTLPNGATSPMMPKKSPSNLTLNNTNHLNAALAGGGGAGPKPHKINNLIHRPNHSNLSPSPATANPVSGGRKLGSFNSLASAPLNKTFISSPPETSDLSDPMGGALSPNPTLPRHRLRFKWAFWILHRSPSKKMSEEEFSRAMKQIGSCDTVETFYSLYLHIKRPNEQTPITDIHMFLEPIKPVWEDEQNIRGGKWTIRLKKGLSNRLWENLIFSLIGGSLERLIRPACSSTGAGAGTGAQDDRDREDGSISEEGQDEKASTISNNKQAHEICGIVLSIRKEEDILAVWHRTGHSELGGDGKIAKQVKLSLQTVLQLPLNCHLSYKLNADSLASGNHHHQASSIAPLGGATTTNTTANTTSGANHNKTYHYHQTNKVALHQPAPSTALSTQAVRGTGGAQRTTERGGNHNSHHSGRLA